MKQLKFVPADRRYRLAGWLLPMLIILIFSCKKSQMAPPPPATEMTSVAKLLDGEIYTGNMEVIQEDEGIVFSCNDGETIIALEKLKPDNLPTSGNIEKSEIIYSDAGIVLRNAVTNETWTYINNDPGSIKEFEKIKSHFSKDPTQSLIHSQIRIGHFRS